MFSKTNLVSTLVAAVWSMGGGFLLWGIIAEPLMAGRMMDGLMKDPLEPAFLAIGSVVQGFGFSTIYRGFGQGNYNPASGIKMGVLFGLMVGFGEKLIDYATSNMMDMQATLINGVTYLVFFGVMGFLAGFIYKRMT